MGAERADKLVPGEKNNLPESRSQGLGESADNPGKTYLSQGSGNFLYLFAQAMNAKRVLQIGTFSGNQTLWLGSAVAHTQGVVEALECNPAKTEIARLNVKTAGLSKTVKLYDQDLDEVIKRFRAPFDLMFLDAPVQTYVHYLTLALPKIRPGGVIIADQAVAKYDELSEFLDFICRHNDLESTLAPIGRGLILTYKKI